MGQTIPRDITGTALASLEIDHSGLEDIVGLLDESLACDGYEAGLFDDALCRLADSVERHFRKEEAWMRKLDYPSVAVHHEQHVRLLAALEDFRRGFASNPVRPNAYIIRGFVDDWLVHHMREVDCVFESFVRNTAED